MNAIPYKGLKRASMPPLVRLVVTGPADRAPPAAPTLTPLPPLPLLLPPLLLLLLLLLLPLLLLLLDFRSNCLLSGTIKRCLEAAAASHCCTIADDDLS